jgi:hypothetical protein
MSHRNRMTAIGPRFRAFAILLAGLTVAGCGSFGGLPGPAGAPTAAPPATPPADMAGRWLLSSPGRGQCHMTFGAGSPTAADGTIRPEGGCPGKFFTSRKWTFEPSGLVIRDHNGQPLAQLSAAASGFNGTATSGEPVTLLR